MTTALAAYRHLLRAAGVAFKGQSNNSPLSATYESEVVFGPH